MDKNIKSTDIEKKIKKTKVLYVINDLYSFIQTHFNGDHEYEAE